MGADRVVSLEVFPIRMSLASPIPMSSGVIESTGNVVVKLVTAEGVTGWGEGVEAPALTGRRQADIMAEVETLRPIVMGADPARRNRLWAEMMRHAPESGTAIAAIDIAMHDVAARALGVPVNRLLGGPVRDRVPALTLLGSGDTETDLARLELKLDQGYSWFKIKLGLGEMGVELATMASAVATVGRDGVVCGDANEAWNEPEAARFLQQLPDGVRFIEQPVSRHEEGALERLAGSARVRLCADESADSLGALARMAGGPLGGASLKLIKHGGITGVMRGAAICSAGDLEVNLAGKVVESSISAAANLHCAAAMDRIEYGCSPANQGVVLDVTEEPLSPDNGEFLVPTGPGLGIEVDESRLRALAG